MIAKKELMPMDKHVGARVRMRRMELGMSQATLGIRLGLTFQQVQKYEKGWNRIGASRLSQIAEILEVPVSWFFEGGEFAKQANAAQGEDPIAMLSTSDGKNPFPMCPSFPSCGCVARGYINPREPNNCGRKPTRPPRRVIIRRKVGWG
jgi:DNA-binding XRE family transcriptional regulator